MRKKSFETQAKRFLASKTALAIPVTYLVLFVSLIVVISTTYSLAVVKINARGALLNASVARQNMELLDDAVLSVAWSFGASDVVYMDDAGGVFRTTPTARALLLNFTDEQAFSDTLFNSSVGAAAYAFVPSESTEYGLFIRGDSRTLINQSAFPSTQLYVAKGDNADELILSYRPLATVATIGTAGGKPLNLIRVYVINLNASTALMLREEFYLKATSLNVSTTLSTYDFSQPVSSLALKAILDGTSTTVWLPISSDANGAAVNVEVVMCNVKIQRVEA